MIHVLACIYLRKVSQLTDLLGGILHCVTDIGKCIFDSNIPYGLLLTCGELGYCCTGYYDT